MIKIIMNIIRLIFTGRSVTNAEAKRRANNIVAKYRTK